MRKTTRFIALAVTSLMVAAVLTAPAGQAQNSLTIDGPSTVKNIQPGLGGQSITLDFRYLFANPASTIGAAEKTFVQVDVTSSCQNNQFLITGPGAVLVTIQAGQSEATQTAQYAVSATREAPGLSEVRCTITGTGQAVNTGGVANPETAPYNHVFTAVANYYGALSVALTNPIEKAGPQKEIPFTLQFNSFSNANTRVVFSIANEADRPSGERWRHVLPTDVIVGSTAKGTDPTADAIFQVSTPYKTGWNNVVGNYLLTMSTEALDDPTQKGNTTTASILVRVRGVYVPGFEVVALLGSLLGSVVLLRGREEE